MAGRDSRSPNERVCPGVVEPGTNVLVLAAGDDAPGDVCTDLCADDGSPGDVLLVECSRDPVDCLDKLAAHSASGRKRLVAVGDDAELRTTRPRIEAKPIPDPTDLSTLGITISEFLGGSSDGGTTVCFHSLTDLLDRASLERVFRFLHVLTSRVDAADAVAHYHLDPASHSVRDVKTIAALFDATVDRFDGEWVLDRAE